MSDSGNDVVTVGAVIPEWAMEFVDPQRMKTMAMSVISRRR